jgi:homoserine kinase
VKVQAPASTANVGPGFDCAAIALDLWDELEVTQDGTPVSGLQPQSLFERAFAKLAPVEGLRFTITRRIPRNGGLGSSAAEIALGLSAGAVAAGRDADPEELLALGLPLEGHPDNLAAALAGGVCLTWGGRVARIADAAPAAPVVLVPREAKTSTREARAALPREISHADAAFSAGRAALLGAAFVSSSRELFAEALEDRLHEPYRERTTPLVTAVRANPPQGMIGATISGSGPSVVVWSDNSDVTAAELRDRFPDTDVLQLAVTPKGAGPV